MAKDIYEIEIGTFRMSLRGMSPDKLRALAEHLADTADAIEDEARRAKARRGLYTCATGAHAYHWFNYNTPPSSAGGGWQ